MPTAFSRAPRTVLDLLAEVMQQHHPALAEAGVTVGCLMADNPDGPALVVHGQPAIAKVKITNLSDRVSGLADAVVTLDEARWNDHPEESRLAILDHELEHLDLVKDAKSGRVKTDDAGRPKLRLRMHDIVIGGFWSVVNRHQAAAVEAQQYRDLNRLFSQQTFPWG